MVRLSNVPLTYYAPALFGFSSMPDPANEELAGVILLGSVASVHDGHAWQKTLEAWCSKVISRDVPLLGICYGHQMIAHMFGGRVVYARDDRQKLRGTRSMRVNSDSLHLVNNEMSLIVTHNEIVTAVPHEFEVMASSKEVEIEGLHHKNKPLFTMQAHPEATLDFVRSREMLDAKALDAIHSGNLFMGKFFDFVSKRDS
jgi:GMP synthase (glutamine-hydrolysing)